MEVWILFLDDERNLGEPFTEYLALDHSKIVIARTPMEATRLVVDKGLPAMMLLDHDLGWKNGSGPITTMDFLKQLAARFDFSVTPPPDYIVHSANPQGTLNIHAFMSSWKKIYNVP